MSAVDVLGVGAISALGEGVTAFSVGAPHERPAPAYRRDAELERAGLQRPFAARAALAQGEGDRAVALLSRAWTQLQRELDGNAPHWRAAKVGLVLGTSGGGLPSLTEALRRRAAGEPLNEELARVAPYFGPLREVFADVDLVLTSQVLGACVSSTIALGVGMRWLDAGHVDLVIAGGYDALTLFIAAGFEALGATSRGAPAPFRVERDGMVLGEGAALLALCRRGAFGRSAWGQILGFGAASDAVHITAPDRTGAGLARAARAALSDAGLSGHGVQLVSAHGTATPFNDAAEANAIAAVLPPQASPVVVHPFKAVVGHTLGAAGALEALAALDATARGVLPGAVGEGPIAPEFSGALLSENRPAPVAAALKLSCAFGGLNAAVVLGRARSAAEPRRELRPVYVRAVGEAQRTYDVARVRRTVRCDSERLERLDGLSERVLAAIASCIEIYGSALPEATGIVLGSAAATLEVNERFDARLRQRGARAVEPRWFPATSPNLACGHASIAWGLQGPAFAVGASPAAATEALLVADDLIAAGDLDHALVVAAEDVGPVVKDVWQAASWPIPESGSVAVLLSAQEGWPVDRRRLLAVHRDCERRHGAGESGGPGWEALLGAIRALTSLPD